LIEAPVNGGRNNNGPKVAKFVSEFVFVLKIKIKSAFTLLFYMRFLFPLS